MMHVRTLLVAALLGTSCSVLAQPGPTVPSTMSASPAQADLAPRVAAHADQLNAADVQKIAARTGKHKRDIQVMTRYGVSYFAWPKGVKPVTFEIQVPNTIVVHAAAYTASSKADYEAAIDAIVPLAVRQAQILKARATRPK